MIPSGQKSTLCIWRNAAGFSALARLLCVLAFVAQPTLILCADSAQRILAAPVKGNSPIAQSKPQKADSPNDLLDEAKRDIDKGDFQSAIAPLQKFLAQQPDFAFAHFQLAYAYTALKRSDEARAEYERTIALDPKMPEAYLNLGILLLDKHEEQAAVAPLRKAVELLPTQPHPKYLLAVALDRSGDHAGAFEAFKALLAADPNDITAIDYVGFTELHGGQFAEAEKNFRHAIRLQPTSNGSRKGLAECLDAEHSPEAVDAYHQYLSLMPNDSEARSRLAHLLFENEQYEAALAELDKADAAKGPSPDSLRMRADIQIAQKKFDEAIATLQQAIALQPKDAQLIGGLGRIYLQKRDFPAAEKYLKAALEIDPQNIVHWKDLSSTYYLAGNYPAALAAMDVIAKAETPNAGTWFIRALCYDKLRQWQPALDAYQKFLSMDQGKDPDQVWQAQQRSEFVKKMIQNHQK